MAESRCPVQVPGMNEVIPQLHQVVEVLKRCSVMNERAAGENLPGGIVLGLDSLVRLLHRAELGGQVVKNGLGGELQTTYAIGVTRCGFGKLVDERLGRKRREQDRA
jgi:hypothetical protein